jgi:hypothetical protein
MTEPLQDLDEHKVSSAIDSALNAVRSVDVSPSPRTLSEAVEVVAKAQTPTPVSDEARVSWGEVIDVLLDMSRYYGWEGEIPEHVLAALENPGNLSPSDLRVKVLKKMHIHLLSKWGRGEIPGPNTAQNLELRARRADETAKNMEKMKKHDAAEQQRQKAASLRAEKPSPSHEKGWW